MGYKTESLSQYVARIMAEKHLSTYDVEARSLNDISQSQVSRIRSGQVVNPGPDTLQALAKGLGVVEEEVFSVVRRKSPEPSVLAQEKVSMLVAKLEKVSAENREYALSLVDLVDRELDRLSEAAA